ncbi:WASH complex subunit 3 [Cephus cinctus]|uniref:WASH complex subunit 3 n=1 Tax=Cephus cinctus TaxID=211228 RepID=A0AAJ7CC45_CEPCN|nr:WASH complex subunit 3 [Cephus cinctus]
MSDYNIPIIEPTIDYTQVPAIHQKRTIAFINHFIVHTVTFLNKFALSCEERLFNFENKLQRVEASLQLLESRLSSIPGLKETPDHQEDVRVQNEEVKNVEISEQTVDEPDTNEIKVEEPESDKQPIKEDPVYGKYFKMLHVGVPRPAVNLKMQQEGLDPSLLDDPQLLVPKAKPDALGESAKDD